MTDTKIKYEFTGGIAYFTDQGTRLNFNPVLSPPTDLTDADIDAILAAVNAQRRTDTAPCGEKAATQPRKLKFIRDNGNSMSVIVPIRSDILSAAQAIWNVLNAKDIKPLCVQLIGEHSFNLFDELASPTRGAPVAIAPIRPSDAKGKHRQDYTGVMSQYQIDAPLGTNVLMPFKSQTNTDGDSPMTELQTYFQDCVDPTIQVFCTGSSSIDYRRYIPSFLTTEPDTTSFQLQTVSVPVKASETGLIAICGQTIAAIQSVACIEYYGESDSKLHKRLTIT